MTEPNPLTFTREEYAARLVRVRERMEKAGIDVLLTTVPENIVYLTGYSTLGYFTYQILILSLDQDPILLTRALNVEKAQVDSCLRNIEGYTDTDDPDDATYRTLQKYRLIGKRISNQDDAWFFSVGRYKKLLRRLQVAELPDGSGIVEQVRKVKSRQEIAYICEAGRYCEASLRAAIEAVVPGATDNDVAACRVSRAVSRRQRISRARGAIRDGTRGGARLRVRAPPTDPGGRCRLHGGGRYAQPLQLHAVPHRVRRYAKSTADGGGRGFP